MRTPPPTYTTSLRHIVSFLQDAGAARQLDEAAGGTHWATFRDWCLATDCDGDLVDLDDWCAVTETPLTEDEYQALRRLAIRASG